MAIVFTVKSGAVISADGVPIVKVQTINHYSVEFKWMGVEHDHTVMVEVGERLDDFDLGANFMPTRIMSAGPNGQVRISCHSNDRSIKFSYK